jgi:predicted enzyme related to lactoylglutathione lyase
MITIVSPPTKSTPSISFDLESKIFKVEGISTIVNAFEFYDGAISWINEHESSLPGESQFHFHLPYFNSASMKGILMLMQRIKEGADLGNSWSIHWNVEDDDEFLLDAAESFEETLGFPIQIKRL